MYCMQEHKAERSISLAGIVNNDLATSQNLPDM